MTSAHTIGFIGGGNMAEALIRGLLSSNFPVSQLVFSEPSEVRQEHIISRFGIPLALSNSDLVKQCEIVVLAIKPQIAAEVLGEIADSWDDSKLMVSILAGVTSVTIEKHFQGQPRVVRVMPNTPALVGEGASTICSGRHTDAADLQTVRELLESVGIVKLIDEHLMDAATGLSGSGPAYIYTVIEALADGGVREGLRRDVAHALAVQTVLGAALMVRETKQHPAILRDQVCSPGGTSIAGVSSLERNGLRTALIEAVSAATARSRELGGN